MHSLNDVATVVEDAPDVFCVYGAREMRITMMATVIAGRSTYSLVKRQNNKSAVNPKNSNDEKMKKNHSPEIRLV